MEDEPNCSCNGGGVAYLLQSVATHFIHTVRVEIYVRINNINRLFTALYNISCLYTATCSKLTGFLLLAARSRVYIRVPYSPDTPFRDLARSVS